MLLVSVKDLQTFFVWMGLKKWEGGRLLSRKTYFGDIVLCLSCCKYNKIDTALRAHVSNARQCPEFRLTEGQRLERCIGSNQSLCVPGTLRLKEACVPFIFLCIKYADVWVNGIPDNCRVCTTSAFPRNPWYFKMFFHIPGRLFPLFLENLWVLPITCHECGYEFTN